MKNLADITSVIALVAIVALWLALATAAVANRLKDSVATKFMSSAIGERISFPCCDMRHVGNAVGEISQRERGCGDSDTADSGCRAERQALA
jgi:hypothetical protein